MGAGHLCASLLPQPPAGPSAHRGPPPGFLCYPIGVSQGCDDALRSAATRRDALTAIISYRRRHYCCECFCSKSPFWLPSRIIGLTPPPPLPLLELEAPRASVAVECPRRAAASRTGWLRGQIDAGRCETAEDFRVQRSARLERWSGGAGGVCVCRGQASSRAAAKKHLCMPAGRLFGYVSSATCWRLTDEGGRGDHGDERPSLSHRRGQHGAAAAART